MPSSPSWTQHLILFSRTAASNFTGNDVTGMAQQIAYNFLFAVAPLLIFLTAFSGLIVQQVNSDIENPALPVLDWLDDNVPEQAAEFLKEPVESAITTNPRFLLSFGGVLTLWAAKNAVAAIMKGLNIIYGIRDSRSFIKKNAMALVLTVGLAVAITVPTALQLLGSDAGGNLAERLGQARAWEAAVEIVAWPVTIVLATGIVVFIHRYAPDFNAPLRWYLPGAFFTIFGLAVAAVGLQLYFAVFGDFSAAYGVFGAVLAFIFFLYIAAIVILAGGILNATLFTIYRPAKTALANHLEAKAAGPPPAVPLDGTGSPAAG